MKRALCCWLTALLLAGLAIPRSFAQDPTEDADRELDPLALNRTLKGRIVDHTHNHGQDRRIWSRSLYQWRDLYVYLPPCYDRSQCYPLIMYLHGFFQDEHSFLRLTRALDAAIVRGLLPPVIVAAPDGSLDGCCHLEKPGSFFVNSNAGPYEDYVLQDVWDFLISHYSIRPEREAHVLAGVSMGGAAAFNLGMRHRNAFGVAIGIFPPLNLRWADSHGNPRADFDPYNWGWRENFDFPREVVGRFGVFPIRMGRLVGPVFGDGEEALQQISANNPIELIDRTRLQNGELAMFIAYAGHDEFNIDAQVESFLYYAKCKGLCVHVAYDPRGCHNWHTANRFLPTLFRWLGPLLAPYSPGLPVAGPPVEGSPTHLP
jgi:S-formylglutathione hydrolase FrmB